MNSSQKHVVALAKSQFHQIQKLVEGRYCKLPTSPHRRDCSLDEFRSALELYDTFVYLVEEFDSRARESH